MVTDTNTGELLRVKITKLVIVGEKFPSDFC